MQCKLTNVSGNSTYFYQLPYNWVFFFISGFISQRTLFLFVYNVVQFIGFSWIFINMSVRLIRFGEGEHISLDSLLPPPNKSPVRFVLQLSFLDSLYDTFHTISDVMFFCQILASVEVLNAAFGIVQTSVVPTLIQVWCEF